MLSALLAVFVLAACAVPALAEEPLPYDGGLRIEDGTLLPMCAYSDPRDPQYSNENSDILRFCVYVETDNDTDNDGMADLVKALVQVPRAAVEGKFKAATIYDPTPYGVGTYDEAYNNPDTMFNKTPFDYDSLYRACEKRTPAGEMSSMDCALAARPDRDWNYTVPQSPDKMGYRYMTFYDYYLVRGFAVVEACGIGTYGSEGFELCGTHLERDSHKAVVEWLTGDRKAFTDKTGCIEIRADWSNGKVAMAGCSYGGTLPFEVATTGVRGLETIIPSSGIASWYDYTNSQGVPTIFDVSYANALAGFNCGGTFLDDNWTVMNKEYGSWLWQIAQDQLETNGNYAPIWEESDYSKDWEDIQCSALIVQGLNDFNVTSKQADLMVQAFEKAGKPWTLVLHQDGHNILDNTVVDGMLWNETLTRWLAYYLYGIENQTAEMPAVLVQSNVDGSWKSLDSWREFTYVDAPVSYDKERNVVKSKGMAEHTKACLGSTDPDDISVEGQDMFYLNLSDDLAAKYVVDLPEGTNIYGVPEIHLHLSSEIQEYEGLMITAVLADTADDGSAFDAYILKDVMGRRLPVRTIAEYEGGSAWGSNLIVEYVQDSTEAKVISYGWTDLTNPGCGYDSSEYTTTSLMTAGEFYDYTIYMLPTAYTVQPGHHLKLILTTWDPYRAFLDESFEKLDMNKDAEEIDYDYSYIVDNPAIRVRIPVAETALPISVAETALPIR
jgi:X-Pro dipeptidyl-peptidase